MKKNVLILISLLVINSKFVINSQTLNKEKFVSETEVTKILKFLASDELNGRDTGSEGIEKAAFFIEDEFRHNGMTPYFDTYRDSFDVDGVAAHNIVGFLKGNDKKLAEQFIIIGAHYDHIGILKEVNGDTIANGANDNAAGSTAVISLAKYFAKTKINKRSVLFVLFSAEEKGLAGSRHLAKILKKKNIDLYAMLNFEMIGVPMKDKPYKSYITGYDLSNIAKKINESGKPNLVGFSPKAKEYNLFQRSDNYSFYQEFKVPCHTISTFDFTNYDYYHHVDDEVSEMNYEFITSLVNDCVPVVSEMLNSSKKEIVLN